MSPGTWPEARNAKAERQRRERRFYTRDKLGKPCPGCRKPVPRALNEAGIWWHPTCGATA